MIVLAIDPGPEKSGVVAWDGAKVWFAEVVPNGYFFGEAGFNLHFEEGFSMQPAEIVFEKVVSYGMAVGADVFETVFWTGRIYEHARRCGFEESRLFRTDRGAVKSHLCQSRRAKDSNIWQALVDRFGPPGTKKAPGVLYGVTSHARAAVALAVTHYDTRHP